MTFDTTRKVCQARYGLSIFGEEDAFFNRVLMLDLVNEAHRWLAEAARCYWAELTADVTADTGWVPCDCNVIEVDTTQPVRWYDGAQWRALSQVLEPDQFLAAHGPREEVDSGDPARYWTRLGAYQDAHRVIELWPTPDTTLVAGVKYAAWVYPGEITGDAQTFALQPAEHHRIVNAVLWKMALADRARGNTQAPNPDSFYQLALSDAQELKRILSHAHRGGTRRVRHRADLY